MSLLFTAMSVVAVQASPLRTVVLAASADGEGGRSVDADLALTSDTWQASAGGSSWRTQSINDDLRGTSLRFFVEGSLAQFGARAYGQYWHADPYALRTLGARVFWSNQSTQLGVMGENKALRIDYSNLFTSASERARFAGQGWGVYGNQHVGSWLLYGSAMYYRYGSLRQFLDRVKNTPPPSFNLALPPTDFTPPALTGAGPGLIDALLGLNQGLFKQQLNVGVGKELPKGTAYLDWLSSKDAIYLQTTQYFTASYVYPLRKTMRVTVNVGVSQSGGYHGQYGGLSWAWDF